VQAHNEGLKRKALGRPAIDPKLIKKKKKPVTPAAEASSQEAPKIVFPSSMLCSKPSAPSIASERKRTQQAEADARKHKQTDASAAPPSQKRQRTKSSKASCRAQAETAPSAHQEPLLVTPIFVAPPASVNTGRRVIVHEHASTEVPVTEDIPAANPTVAEDIGIDANVQNEDDAVLPLITPDVVSSPVQENSEPINIGRPLMPMDHDEVIPHTPPP
jgi:hypothetical protein